jgi:hypothetical protein
MLSCLCFEGLLVCLMVFNTTFNNISVISWWSVLLVEEISVQRKPPTCCKSLTNFITCCNICVTNDHRYVPLVVNTSQSFPHSWLITGFVTRLIRWVPLVEEELFILLELLSSCYLIFSFMIVFNCFRKKGITSKVVC